MSVIVQHFEVGLLSKPHHIFHHLSLIFRQKSHSKIFDFRFKYSISDSNNINLKLFLNSLYIRNPYITVYGQIDEDYNQLYEILATYETYSKLDLQLTQVMKNNEVCICHFFRGKNVHFVYRCQGVIHYRIDLIIS